MGMYMKLLRQHLSHVCHIRSLTYSSLVDNLRNTLNPECITIDKLTCLHGMGGGFSSHSSLLMTENCLLLPGNTNDSILSTEHIARLSQYNHLNTVRFKGLNDQMVHYTDLRRECDHMNMSTRNVHNVKQVVHHKVTPSVNKEASAGGEEEDDSRDGPTPVQLEIIKEYYLHVIPKFSQRGEDLKYGLHHKDIVFENYFNKKPVILRGLNNYHIYILKMNLVAPLFYCKYGYEVVGITTHPNEGTVRLHWRLSTCSNIQLVKRTIKSIFTFRVPKLKEMYDTREAISTFTVNKDGKIIKHRVDRLIPMQSSEPLPNPAELAVKTAKLMGLAPKTNFSQEKTKVDKNVS